LLIALILGILVLVVPTIGLGYGYLNSSVSSAINSAIGGGVTPTPTPGGGTPSPTPAPPVTYRAAVLATNPLAYWRLGETSGTTAVDEMGANNGTYVGSPTLGVAGLLTGDSNTAMSPGGSAWVTLAEMPAGDASSIVWVKTTATSQQWAFGRRSAGGRYMNIGMSATGHALFGYEWGGQVTGPVINDGLVHMLGLSWIGTTIYGYVDGALVGNTSAGTTNPGALMEIGAYNEYQPWTGTVDEAAYWVRALSEAEVAALYAAGTGF
jgi:hypothetical protein